MVSNEIIRTAIRYYYQSISDHFELLTNLDTAIGDGDHGENMVRGMKAVVDKLDAITCQEMDQVVHDIGLTLVMKIGGASGPLYGSFFMSAGKFLQGRSLEKGTIAEALNAGVKAVKHRGKSRDGEKTLLDVMVPVYETFMEFSDSHSRITDYLNQILVEADRGLESTRLMKATKGRASFLGDRSIGHLDPGAKSCQLMFHSICQAVRDHLKEGELAE
ncbi:MAG: dihydroxyacetone kinase subunit L [Deltaproteobacteria bacterium]|nr:dihydroxyacetone kinase subunit L [Deltaproteobacteria bacterium]MBT4643018.1 dihydroxyacetone kinase subunit L [Deltaproteobacteria bacterium]MBT6614455.1 dihydroxyacetone kinase subunit L [Deltaproteobacteria bacterium]